MPQLRYTPDEAVKVHEENAIKLPHPEIADRPQSTQNKELASLLLTNVQTRSRISCVISKKPRCPLPPL
jgi:hypothetical protein